MNSLPDEKTIVPPELYDQDYYLKGNDGFREYLDGLDTNMHDKFKRVWKFVDVKEGDKVLDLGCGRGELVYYAAKCGAKVLGLDYSEDAIKIARETVKGLPTEMQSDVVLVAGTAEDFDFPDIYDYVFMVETAEHMHEWQLRQLILKMRKHLKPGGQWILTTPNYLYEKYFEPVKRTLNVPFKFFKFLFRLPRGKYPFKSWGKFFKDVFRIRVDRGDVHKRMHCHVTTPASLKNLFVDFDVQIICEDHSINPLSLLLKKWFGRYVVVIVRHKGQKGNASD